MRHIECDFCDRLAKPGDYSWWDFHLLYQTPHFVVVAALAPICLGHTLLVSRAHVESLADLAEDVHRELLVCLAEAAVVLSAPSLPIAEHGSGGASLGSACLAHAHLHLVPNPVYDPLLVTGEGSGSVSSSLPPGPEWRNRDYLLTGRLGGPLRIREAIEGDKHRIQRALTGIDDPEHWDYVANPRLGLVAATVEAWYTHRHDL